MYVAVEVAPRTLANATVVPAQAVQTGPDGRFIYEVNAEGKVVSRPVTLAYVDEGIAAVDGIAAGARIVVEGAQNVRPGTAVAEADRGARDAAKTGKEEPRKGKKAS
jgi:multidrug efflux pump subunit AcrA (membrane-fusion protein)